jgi:hypothetical protein
VQSRGFICRYPQYSSKYKKRSIRSLKCLRGDWFAQQVG